MRAEIVVRGMVQGVGFRPLVYRLALKNRLLGYVRNRGDAGVDVVIEGSDSGVQQFIESLKEQKSPLAQIYEMSINYVQERGDFTTFSIIESVKGGSLPGSIIPYDISLCDKCLAEFRDVRNRRHNYFFITCTECGPRYTIINKLPYDRLNTTMQDFPMCKECMIEYNDPADRRFHAQTIACQTCGPHMFLTDNTGKVIEGNDPIRQGGHLLEEGFILAIKGNGGFHIATSSLRSKPIMRLREVKHRLQKPFAIMAHNLDAVKSFAELDDAETELLNSSARPIVLLKKSRAYYLSEFIAPGLHNLGVLLPYSGLHYLLFEDTEEPAFVMTSANPPSEPILADNEEALLKFGNVVDFFLFHNRAIAQRCDDSVIRVHNGATHIIRRSRGYAPSPVRLQKYMKYSTLGLGAEENVTVCVLLGDQAFQSQYIGNVEQLETLKFLEHVSQHLLKLTNSKIMGVGCDLHPQFITTKLAYEFGRNFSCPVFPIQHHYAHALSLMEEKGVTEFIGIVCDGAGYGLDGNIWGGEILYCTFEAFRRLGHLQEQPMAGGDLATKNPLRMVAGMLRNSTDITEWLFSKASYFPYRDQEIELLLQQLKMKQMPMTSSCGRVLDAVSALLGICFERTYEGEPAMKLESAAVTGKDVLQLDPEIDGGIINTTHLLHTIFEGRKRYSVPDLAYSAETYLAKSLALVAINGARERGLKVVGFSGGVAYNEHMALTIKDAVEDQGLKFIVHDQVPPGDGGISFGQAVRASHMLDSKKVKDEK